MGRHHRRSYDGNVVQPPYRRRTRKRISAPVKTILAVLAAYLLISVYNGYIENEATKTTNAFLRKTLGYEMLADKGIAGYGWFYFTHPTENFESLGLSADKRVSYLARDLLGVWRLEDYRPDSAVKGASVGSSAATPAFRNDSELFKIENLTISKIDNGALWSDVTFAFDFIANKSLDQYRDSAGKVLISTFVEYYNADGTVAISQTYGFDALRDGRYSDTVMCDDTSLRKDRIISITFDLFLGDFAVRYLLS